ncbi:MAG: type II toxin-antitoxin system RelE/ParE family toxin [Chloroflexi bacterium]|nr:type II toxin-antitoxin system RelE/ParE family toxin [Chloroflexota bacterium]
MYQAVFSRRARKVFLGLPEREAIRLRDAIAKLTQEPRSQGTIKLESTPVAGYRYRTGDLRLLFNLDDERKVIRILDTRKRDEKTYK